MPERDRYDLDLRAALRDFAEDAPTDVRPAELARRFAVEHPRGRILLPPWRPALLPRLAWVLLLVGLLVALGAGALMIGSRLARTVPAVLPPIGQTFVCPPGSTPDEPGPIDQARPVGSGAVAFDRRAGRLVAVPSYGGVVETWTFDVCTNTWTRMHPNREPPDFAWRPLVYDVDSDLVIGVAYGPDGAPPGRVWAYDFAADTWTEKSAPTDKTLRTYDPRSGLVVATKDLLDGTGEPERWTYDVDTDTWALIDRAIGPAWHAGLAYDASVDRIVAYAAPETWLLDTRSATWSRVGAETPVVEPNWAVPTITYDESVERTVVTGSAGMAAYDAAADRWEVLARPGELPANPTVYDPVNGRLVGFGWGGDVVVFDLKTREWTVLLEPSGIPDEVLVAELAALMSTPYDAAKVAALYAPDAVVHDLVENLTQSGLEEIGARIRYFNTQDFKVVVTSAPIRQDNYVATFVRFGGGEAAFSGLIVYELKDGKVVNQWVYLTP